MKKVLIIIPAYNEEENILKTYKSIEKYNNKNKAQYDCIVINDGSTDKTKKILEDNNIPHINLIHNLGIGGAVQTGYKYAFYNNYDIAVQFDGDGQHDVNYVKNIIDPILDGKADMVIGSRFIDKKSNGFKSSASRRIGIKIISNFIKFATGKKIYDTTSGFRAVSKEIIYDFSLSYPSEYPEPITTAEILKKKYKVSEVSVEMKEREGGVSSIRAWKNIYYMMNVCLALLAIKIRRYKRCQ
jgi:glycosyltransferase